MARISAIRELRELEAGISPALRAGLRILYVGDGDGTCLQRAGALRRLGHTVHHVVSGCPKGRFDRQFWRVANRLGLVLSYAATPPDLNGANRSILRSLRATPFDLLWIDKGREIRERTLNEVRRAFPGIVIVAYSPDDMMNPHNQSVRYLRTLPMYDVHVTTKSYNVAELRRLGARDVLFIDNAFDPETHRPFKLTDAERRRYATDVGFVGGREAERDDFICRLAEHGIPVTVHGSGWERRRESHPDLHVRCGELVGTEYSKAIGGTRINLGFLRKVNRDLQTTRSIEIPACGGFLLAERTEEHRRLFEEGKEAEFFGSFEELLEKCRYYLAHERARARIAAAGLRRCLQSDYSNEARLGRVLAYAMPTVSSEAPNPSTARLRGRRRPYLWGLSKRHAPTMSTG